MDMYIWTTPLSSRPYATIFDVKNKAWYQDAVPQGSYLPGVWNKVMLGWQVIVFLLQFCIDIDGVKAYLGMHVSVNAIMLHIEPTIFCFSFST